LVDDPDLGWVGAMDISIKSTDKGFKTTGCGTWTRDD